MFGGIGTSARAFELTEFARTTREGLGLRVISVERNGFGETPLDPGLGFEDAVDDVLLVLDLLEIEQAAVVAISGGGPFAAALAARAPDRLSSFHLAAAASGPPIAAVPLDPVELWRFPPDSPVHRVPGFDGAAAAEGLRAVGHARGMDALEREWRLIAGFVLPSLHRLLAPAYLYWGTDDSVVSPEHADRWRAALGGEVTIRLYQGEAHDVQYRHWDQILIDASGLGERILVCREGLATLVEPDQAGESVRGGAKLGLCAWSS